MSNYVLKLFYALLLLILFYAEAKCIERERQALLKFKQSLHDASGMLSTWRDNEDCCKWKGIECNNETGYIQKLVLRGHDTQYMRGAINFTVLTDLQNMEYLDLSFNDFRGSNIPKCIALFTKLTYLNLSDSLVGGIIPYQLGNLSHLQYLDLGGASLSGEIPFEIGNLRQLQYLDLRGNSFIGSLPFQIGNLPNLHTLRLSGNFDIKTKDAEWLSTLYSLTNLELTSFGSLGSSHHWLQIIRNLIPNLRELRLVGCGLLDNDIVSIFNSHSNFSNSLTILDLSHNMLTSSTFEFLSNLSFHLQELYLSYNNIVMSSPLYTNFPYLVILDLSYNNLASAKFQGNFNFSSKLQKLYVTNCKLITCCTQVKLYG